MGDFVIINTLTALTTGTLADTACFPQELVAAAGIWKVLQAHHIPKYSMWLPARSHSCDGS